MAKKRSLSDVYVLDIETTPFAFNIEPVPFLVVLWHKDNGIMKWWGDDCIEKSAEWIIANLSNKIIYAHNGGKFDFMYYLKLGYITNPLVIISRRIVSCKIGKNYFRDSLAIIPISLAKYQKTEIDYDLFKATKREQHKKQITDYCIDDCIFLYDLIKVFIDKNGFKLTVGAASKANIERFYGRKFRTNARYDERIRPYYMGGRVECFETGVIEGDFKYLDVNSLYPYAMTKQHFCGDTFFNAKKFTINKNGNLIHNGNTYDNIYFAHISVSKNLGALGKQDAKGILNFNQQDTDFYATSHEIKIALKYDLITITEYHDAFVSLKPIDFKAYTKEMHKLKQNSDKLSPEYQIYKLLMNAGYGKFGQNANEYKDYKLQDNEQEFDIDDYFKRGYKVAVHSDKFTLFEKPDPGKDFVDVGIAASITGLARSIMLEIIATSKRPIYCDTDSLICESADDRFIGNELGDLELEHDNIDTVIVASKKMYEIYRKGELIGHASKGICYADGDIKKLVAKGILVKENIAPTMALGKKPTFITRHLTYIN